jgi:hypothetical protein
MLSVIALEEESKSKQSSTGSEDRDPDNWLCKEPQQDIVNQSNYQTCSDTVEIYILSIKQVLKNRLNVIETKVSDNVVVLLGKVFKLFFGW